MYFIYGDPVISALNISLLKRKNKDYSYFECDISEDNFNKIRMEVGALGIGYEGKIIVLKSIPNQKAVRSFILELCKEKLPGILLVAWDSENIIKRDAKTLEINKTWSEFIDEVNAIDGCKAVNVGFDFTDKETKEMAVFMQERCKKKGFEIGTDACLALYYLIGGNRAIINSELDKLMMTSPARISYSFVLANTFPIIQEPVLWKLSAGFDKLNLTEAYLMATEYMGQGVNANVIAEILAKKAKWQLAACSLWKSGYYWPDVEKELLRMGKFPSEIWHSEKSQSEKKSFETEAKSIDKTIIYLKRSMGLDERYYQDLLKEDAKLKTGDCLPLPFFATQIVNLLQEKLVRPNSSKYEVSKLKDILLNRAVSVYNVCTESLKNIRYGEPPEQEVYIMLKALLDYSMLV